MQTIANRYAFVAIFTAFLTWALVLTGLYSYWSELMIKNYWEVEEEKREMQMNIEQSEAYYKNYLLTKKQIRLIREGLAASQKGKHKEAVTKLYYAKTIFPYDPESRFYLIYGLMKACEQKGRYCGNAQKEIQRMYDFIEARSLGQKQIRRVNNYAVWWKRLKRQ